MKGVRLVKKIYYAAPLFSEMEFAYNEHIVRQIRETYPDYEIYVPQEQGDINDKTAYADSKMIALADTQAVLESDLLLAVIDGTAMDPGVASEIGVAYQAEIPIIALYSDSRQQGADNAQKIEALQDIAESQFSYVNLYTVGLVKLRGEVVNSSQAMIDAIGRYL